MLRLGKVRKVAKDLPRWSGNGLCMGVSLIPSQVFIPSCSRRLHQPAPKEPGTECRQQSVESGYLGRQHPSSSLHYNVRSFTRSIYANKAKQKQTKKSSLDFPWYMQETSGIPTMNSALRTHYTCSQLSQSSWPNWTQQSINKLLNKQKINILGETAHVERQNTRKWWKAHHTANHEQSISGRIRIKSQLGFSYLLFMRHFVFQLFFFSTPH